LKKFADTFFNKALLIEHGLKLAEELRDAMRRMGEFLDGYKQK